MAPKLTYGCHKHSRVHSFGGSNSDDFVVMISQNLFSSSKPAVPVYHPVSHRLELSRMESSVVPEVSQ
jgi:hypothetical protein